MPIETLTRGAKRSYEELKAQETQRGISNLLFPTKDEDLSAGFLLDTFIQDPHGVVYREISNQSHYLEYQAGQGNLFEVPIASEKTPVPEDLNDVVIDGVEANEGYGPNQVKTMNRIVQIHIASHNMTSWKQALDVIRTGTFQARGIDGADIGLDIDFSRDAGNSLTADFSSVTIDDALTSIHDQMNDQNTPGTNRVVIMGSSWLGEFSNNTAVREFLQANTANTLLTQSMVPPELLNTKGLYVVATYRPPTCLYPFLICSYNPGFQYVAYKGATAAPWVPDAECMAFSLDDVRYYVNRGVTIVDENGRKSRNVGDIVFDTFVNDDPVTEFMRSHTRHAFIPANVDHTIKSTGSNFN